MMIEPPRKLLRCGVLKIHNRILIGIKQVEVEEFPGRCKRPV
jgi:hypothetical protein